MCAYPWLVSAYDLHTLRIPQAKQKIRNKRGKLTFETVRDIVRRVLEAFAEVCVVPSQRRYLPR